MNDLEKKLFSIEEEFNIYKKKIEKYHLIFIILYFSIITLVILFFQIYLPLLYNNFNIKIFLFSLMIFGLLIHYYLRFKYFKSKICYYHFFKNKLEELKKSFSKKENFNKLIITTVNNIIKNNESTLPSNNQNKLNFWQLLLKFLNFN